MSINVQYPRPQTPPLPQYTSTDTKQRHPDPTTKRVQSAPNLNNLGTSQQQNTSRARAKKPDTHLTDVSHTQLIAQVTKNDETNKPALKRPINPWNAGRIIKMTTLFGLLGFSYFINPSVDKPFETKPN